MQRLACAMRFAGALWASERRLHEGEGKVGAAQSAGTRVDAMW
jgi:hypothetical protein